MTNAAKSSLLFLCHRIPYPPNKGDKIRSYHVLLHLAERYKVFLGAFVDDPDDWEFERPLRQICEDCCLVSLNPQVAKIKSLSGFVTGQALTLPYYSNKKLSQWVNRLLTDDPGMNLFVFSSAMAQFALYSGINFNRKIIDVVDIDSDKWKQYAAQKRWPASWVYRRESEYLLRFEKEIANYFDTSMFVSKSEADEFSTLVPSLKRKISYFNNGVNSEYFAADVSRHNPYPEGVRVIIFTGAMDYWPNIDAVCWFAESVFPALAKADPGLCFYIVGSNPDASVVALGGTRQVMVTGKVPDIRPYLQYATVAIAPMRIARGVQNKVLEAMSMKLPVVVSEMGLEGIEAKPNQDVLVARKDSDYLGIISAILNGDYDQVGISARKFVISNFSWQVNLERLDRALSNTAPTVEIE